MKKLPPLPENPAVEDKLRAADLPRIVEALRRRSGPRGRLKDGIAVLKGGRAHPKSKPGGMEAEAGGKESRTLR